MVVCHEFVSSGQCGLFFWKRKLMKGSSEQAVYSQRIWNVWLGNVKQYLASGNVHSYIWADLIGEYLKEVAVRLETFLLLYAYQ